MSSIFEFIPIDSTAQPVTPSEFVAALPPFLKVRFSDASSDRWSDFEIDITHEEMRKRYPDPMEFYLDTKTHCITTRVVSSAFSLDESAIFAHVLGLMAQALKAHIHNEATGEVEPPEFFMTSTLQEDFTARVIPDEELQQAVVSLASAMKKVG